MKHQENERPGGFFHWPGVETLIYAYLVLGIPSLIWFVFVYGGANYLTTLHKFRLPLYCEAELRIPFVPWTIVFYNSLHLVYSIAPFVIQSRCQMRALVRVWFWITLAGGCIFLVIPFEPGFPPPETSHLGIWRRAFEFADAANLQFNSCPSLHVAWGVVCLDVYRQSAGRWMNALLIAWCGGLCASTVLLHQHHVIDVVAGIALAAWGSRVLYPGFQQAAIRTQTAADCV